MRIVAPPGTQDTLPEEIRMRRFVEDVFMEHCRCGGYSEIHTPVFEYSELFEEGVGHVTDIVEKELYTFTDKNGDRLALRPEGTSSVARAFIQHGMENKLPRKFCYKITCYRQEDPEKGRLREFHQIGAECYGSKFPQADSELIVLAYTTLTAMGAGNLTLNINSLGCESCRTGYINTLTRYLLPHANSGALCQTCVSRMSRNPLRILDCKNPSCRAVAEKAPKLIDFLCSDCRSHFETVGRGIKAAGIPFNIKTRLIRGLDYYNRTVFEIKAGEGGSNGTVCGGGRYDSLCRRIGAEKNVPAVGFAIGEERAIIAMRENGIKEIPPDPPKAWVISVDGAMAGRGAAKLRSFGIHAERDLMGLNIKAQAEEAKGSGAAWLVTAEENGICAVSGKSGREYVFNKDDWAEVARVISNE